MALGSDAHEGVTVPLVRYLDDIDTRLINWILIVEKEVGFLTQTQYGMLLNVKRLLSVACVLHDTSKHRLPNQVSLSL